jgi:hypothetical protein
VPGTETHPKPLDSHKRVSGITGAVHIDKILAHLKQKTGFNYHPMLYEKTERPLKPAYLADNRVV